MMGLKMDLSDSLPQLTRTDYVRLAKLRKDNPQVFSTNSTSFFLNFMRDYIATGRVFRVSIMGETRQGKSEIGSTIAFNYVRYFNHFYKKGLYDNLSVKNLKSITISELDFNINNVFASQFEYNLKLKELVKNNELKLGQIWQIDEDKRKIGGIGSYSEKIEIDNLNNIIAKFMQSEIWITPDKMITQNCPYGLYAFKKDIPNRINWCLLYKIETTASGSNNFEFMGWVCIPLHNNDKFRKDYNDKKDAWIEEEIIGSSDPRMKERHRIAKQIYVNNVFELTDKGNFKFSRDEQISFLETLIIAQEIQNFNEVEKIRIIDSARTMRKMERVV